MNVEDVKNQIKALQDTLANALAEAKNLNQQADAVVDKGLNVIEQSPYTTQIVAGIALGMLTVGGLIGWAAKAFFG